MSVINVNRDTITEAWMRYCSRADIDTSFNEYCAGYTLLTGAAGSSWLFRGFDAVLAEVRCARPG